jgi:hypothetical protein
MKQEGLISNYTVTQFKPHVAKCNEEAWVDPDAGGYTLKITRIL